MHTPAPAAKQPQRFTVLPALDSFEVIDEDGRPVDRRDTRQSANGVAYTLNYAARGGPQRLARALRAA